MLWAYIFGLLLGLHITSSYRDSRYVNFVDNIASNKHTQLYNFYTSNEHYLPFKNQSVFRKGLPSTKPHPYLIRKIDLQNNKLMEVKNDLFDENSVCLLELELSHNIISTIRDGAFSKLKFLQKLDLSYNQLTELNNNAFALTNKIDFINLNNNKLKTIEKVTNLKSITVLKLANNILELHPGMFKNFSKLLDLDLSGNNISYIPLGLFEGIPKLKYLNLGFNQLEAFATGSFSGIPMLNFLNLSSNLLSSIELTNEKVFLPISNIHSLILDGNTKLIDLNATLFKNIFRNLSYLGVGKIPWTCEGLLKFLKNCQDHLIISEHTDLVTNNIHGVACTEDHKNLNKTSIRRSFIPTTHLLPTATNAPSKEYSTNNNNLENLINKMVSKAISTQKNDTTVDVITVVVLMLFILITISLIIFIVFKDQIIRSKRPVFIDNTRSFSFCKNEYENNILEYENENN